MDDKTVADLQLETSEEIDEEVFEDDWGSTEEEEDWKEKEKLARDEDSDVGALAADTAALSVACGREAVVDFLRSFLSHMGMTHTLDCFQSEWHEMVQKGRIDASLVDMMPEVYIQNRHLETELKNAQKERDDYKQAISAAKETVVKIQKARDFHWLRHKRSVQEKNKLMEDVRKLTNECKDCQPEIKRMNEKYQKLVQQTVNATLRNNNDLLKKNPQ